MDLEHELLSAGNGEPLRTMVLWGLHSTWAECGWWIISAALESRSRMKSMTLEM